ncbi:MAG: hypothetical protein IPL84_13110 [Chitinophagaceae bacterium]|nr:hypothetical protein [Chitinophagaceae bacterium]
MKKYLIVLVAGFALILFLNACAKEDTQTTNQATVVGTWSGTGQYGTIPGGSPTYAFTLTFKVDGTVNIIGDNNTGPDTGTGTWVMVQDSVQAIYTYTAGSALYKLSGKFSTGSNTMAGTIGLTSATTGVGIFTVTRQ